MAFTIYTVHTKSSMSTFGYTLSYTLLILSGRCFKEAVISTFIVISVDTNVNLLSITAIPPLRQIDKLSYK